MKKKLIISKKDLTSISFDPETSLLSIHWDTGGKEGAINGIGLKVEFVKEYISTYKAPIIKYDPNYNNPF